MYIKKELMLKKHNFIIITTLQGGVVEQLNKYNLAMNLYECQTDIDIIACCKLNAHWQINMSCILIWQRISFIIIQF